MKNRSDKEIIGVFIKLTKYLKSRVINLGFHIMENEGYKALKITIKTMNIKYQLVLPSNHRRKNEER